MTKYQINFGFLEKKIEELKRVIDEEGLCSLRVSNEWLATFRLELALAAPEFTQWERDTLQFMMEQLDRTLSAAANERFKVRYGQ